MVISISICCLRGISTVVRLVVAMISSAYLNLPTDNKLADYYWTKTLSAPKLGKLKLKEDLVVKSGIPTNDSSWGVLREILGLVRGDGTVVKYKDLIEKAQTLIEQLSPKAQS